MSVTDLTPTPDSCATLRAAHEFSSWCSSPGKRALDWVCAMSLLLAALPLMVIVAALIKFTSQGPAFFRQTRVGRDGALFQLMKFRTMYDGGRGPRLALTRRGDPRVTRVGRVLRKWKLDELPQLLNVVRGEMSLVGPRPDLPDYIRWLPADQHSVVFLRPGITGRASLQFRDEEVLLAQVPAQEMEGFYRSVLLPRKVTLELEYARGARLSSDIGILLRTVGAVFGGARQ